MDAADMSEDAEAAIDASLDLCSELESKLSRTRKDSDISRLNAAKGEWTEVSPETIELIRKGLEYSELSGGAFDITVGGITELWDFHAPEGEAKIPDEEAVANAVKHVGYKGVEIDGSKVRLSDPGAKIDLGGIAKGYIGDKMTEALEESGVVSGVTAWGIYVELPNTVEGMISVQSLLDDYYFYDEERYVMMGRNTGRVFQLGEKVEITVTGVDKMAKTIDFELAEFYLEDDTFSDIIS
jgi:hypothetical protein